MVLFGLGLAGPVLSADTITVGGTGSALGTIKALAQAFEKSHPGFKIDVMPSLGSSGSIKAVSQGALDLAISARPLKADEEDGLSGILLAKTPFIFYSSKEVLVPGLTTQELVDIYLGNQIRWPGGQRIRLILRPESDMEIQIVKGISPEMEKAMDAALSREGIFRAATDQECADRAQDTPGALAFGGLSQIISEKRPLNVLSLNGVEPSVTTLASGKYPLSISCYIVVKNGPSPRVREFMEFMRSPEGASILRKNGNLVPGK